MYIIRKKSDTFAVFEEWKALVEPESGEKVCCLCIDGGGKYFSANFIEHCKTHRICQLVNLSLHLTTLSQMAFLSKQTTQLLDQHAQFSLEHACCKASGPKQLTQLPTLMD